MQPDVVASVERLSWGEVCRRYPDQWVVVVDTVRGGTTHHPFDSAVVVAHCDRRSDASSSVKAALLTHDVVGTYWTGRIAVWPGTWTARR